MSGSGHGAGAGDVHDPLHDPHPLPHPLPGQVRGVSCPLQEQHGQNYDKDVVKRRKDIQRYIVIKSFHWIILKNIHF